MFEKVIKQLEELYEINQEAVLEKVIENFKRKSHAVVTKEVYILEELQKEVKICSDVLGSGTYIEYHHLYGREDKALVSNLVNSLEDLYGQLGELIYKINNNPALKVKPKSNFFPSVDFSMEEEKIVHRDRLPNNFLEQELKFY